MKNQKLKIQNQKNISKLIIVGLGMNILFFTLYFLHLAPAALGQSPSPQATPTTEEAVDEKIQGVREAVKEKVQERLAETKKRAFVGEVVDRTDTTLTLETPQGEKQTKAGEQTIIIGLSKKEIKFEEVEIGSFAIAMGYVEEGGILDARRIVISEKPKVPTRTVVFGLVDDISAEEKILKVKHQKKGTVYEVQVSSETKKITKKIKGKIEKIKFEEIKIGDRLVAIGTSEKNNSLTAKIIHVIPGKAVGQAEPTPTNKPTVTLSPTTSPTPAEEE